MPIQVLKKNDYVENEDYCWISDGRMLWLCVARHYCVFSFTLTNNSISYRFFLTDNLPHSYFFLLIQPGHQF